MTRARAPGKVVLSGAYAVLHGAPAIVTTVGRYVSVDSARPAELVTPEVQAALANEETPWLGRFAPWFDASELWDGDRKLGLGSSAAILIASLYALARDVMPEASEIELRGSILGRAAAAHRSAQGGGSGVDVTACCVGGTLCYRLGASGSGAHGLPLPAGLQVELWSCPEAASTRQLLGAVAALGARAPGDHDRLMSAQAAASERAVEAATSGDATAFIAALRTQHRALSELGRVAGVPIVTPELAELGPAAEREAGVLLPAGAGGGDIALFVGRAPSTPGLRASLEQRAHHLLPVALSVPGVALA